MYNATVNRTNVELKLYPNKIDSVDDLTVNRTNVELK